MLRPARYLRVGSSPRMRGALRLRMGQEHGRRIIPAYAGSTTRRRSEVPTARDHPRVCGEHSFKTFLDLSMLGSSPRMRGARSC